MPFAQNLAKPRGFALVTVLLFCSILMMMVLALFLSVRGELFVSQAYRNQTSALYLAETGLWETTLRPPGASQNALYHSGDLTIQGDLVLEGVKLYVAGSSTLQGDARIASATPDTIALFSQGNVKLSGFSGTEYMEALAAQDTVIAQAWNQLSLYSRSIKSISIVATMAHCQDRAA